MNRFKFLFLMTVLNVFFNAPRAVAMPTCYDLSKINTDRENLPEFLHKLPVIYTMESIAKGAIELSLDDGKLKTVFNIKAGVFGSYKDESYVKRICKDGNAFIFNLEPNAAKIEIKQKGEKLFLKGQELKKSNEVDFDQALRDVSERTKPLPGPQAPGIGGSN